MSLSDSLKPIVAEYGMAAVVEELRKHADLRADWATTPLQRNEWSLVSACLHDLRGHVARLTPAREAA